MRSKSLFFYSYFFSGLIIYYLFAYTLMRDNEVLFLSLSFLAFTFFFIGVYSRKNGFTTFSLKKIFFLAVSFRLIFLFAIPNLSDDFFRFIWDGQLVKAGINPFHFLPSQLVGSFSNPEQNALMEKLYYGNGVVTFPEGLNSKNYYSVYPPFNQYLFALAAWVGKTNFIYNLISLRLIIIFFEVLLLAVILKLIKLSNSSYFNLTFYALNPMVIWEITGNLHFEGITLTFLLLSILLIMKSSHSSNRSSFVRAGLVNLMAGLAYGVSILTKLIPLIFLPYFLIRLGRKKLATLIFFFGGIALPLIALTSLFFPNPQAIKNFFTSINLYFFSFEFNASLYYLIREIGLYFLSYNPIQIVGGILPTIIFGLIIMVYLFYHNFYHKNSLPFELKNEVFIFQIALLIYYSLASIVHPWYIIYFIGFSTWGRNTFRHFPLWWGFGSLLSYLAYKDVNTVKESYWLVALEYVILLIAVWVEVKKKKFKYK